jgi:hypothetical protein
MKGDHRLMRCVTGVVSILPFPVLIFPAGAHPRHYSATAETPAPHRLLPDLQNKTGAVINEPNFAVIVRHDDHPPSSSSRLMELHGKKPKIME